MPSPDTTRSYPIPGYHAVRESLLHGRIRIGEIWIGKGGGSPRIREIERLAAERDIPVYYKGSDELARVVPDTSHQRIVALAAEIPYTDVGRLTKRAGTGKGLLLAVDHVTDEGNLAALVRTAAFFGVQGMILPKDRSARITPTVFKRSSGACVFLPVARVVNLDRCLEELKAAGFWVVGTSTRGTDSPYGFDWERDLVLVLGNEQRGLTRTVERRCDALIRIPGSGKVESLNVAVAGGVIFSEILRQRLGSG